MALIDPEFLQVRTYTALRDRLALEHGGQIQPGVWASGDFKATQRGAGANMSVDVAAGFALVPANDVGNKGLYHVENDGVVNVAIGASHATLPRIDQIILRVNDSTHGGDAGDTPTLTTLAGTATSGATLDNRTGAAALPTGALRLADVLVGAGVTSITNANIRDRRPWARGAYYRNAITSGDIALTQNAWVSIGGAHRIECSGVPIECGLHGHEVHGTGNAMTIEVALLVDGSTVATHSTYNSAGFSTLIHPTFTQVPAAGSHTFEFQVRQNSAAGPVFRATAAGPAFLRFAEMVRQSALNA